MINDVESYKNVFTEVVSNDLCISCGTCKIVCPKQAIDFHFSEGLFLPSVSNACINCGICLKTCPSYKIDLDNKTAKELVDGKIIDSLIIHSFDKNTRENGTSGGVITQLCISLIERHIYDRVCVVGSNTDQNQTIYTITDQIDEIQKACKSKYIPVSNQTLLKYITNKPNEKLIICATPCMLLSIQKFLKLKKIDSSPFLFLGLFCGGTFNYNIFNFYKTQYGSYQTILFRDKKFGNGWPGNTVLIRDNGNLVVDRSVRMKLKSYYLNNRCRFCLDKLNTSADISFGDCYIPGFENKEGLSNIIIRTDKGANAIKIVIDAFYIQKIEYDKIIQSQMPYKNFQAFNWMRRMQPQLYINYSNIQVSEQTAFSIESYEKLKMGRKNSIIEISKQIGLIKRSLWEKLGSFIKQKIQAKQYFVLIDGVGFVNKGAELMLLSIISQIRENLSDCQIVLRPNVYYSQRNFCQNNHILPLKIRPSIIAKLKNAIYKIVGRQKFIDARCITTLLDAGGFQFGSQWDTLNANFEDKEKYYQSFTKKNRKIIFLPQAFGPFDSDYSIKYLQMVNKYADVFYVRDSVSEQFIMSLPLLQNDMFKIYPDFTCLYKPEHTAQQIIKSNLIAIIPNYNIGFRKDESTMVSYIDFLKQITQYLIDKGKNVVFLNHEGEDDAKILYEVNNKLSQTIPVLTDLSANEVKWLIGSMSMVITARFHGAVSSLSQGIPTLCMSWNHKYEELLKDYNMPFDAILNTSDISMSIQTIEKALQHIKQYTPNKDTIQRLENLSIQMWREIFNRIKMPEL